MNILIVDKAIKVRSAIGLLLYQQPRITATYEANDVVSALDMAARYTFEIILLDWALAEKTSMRLVEQLQALQPHVAIIALSSCPGSRQAALQSGARTFVSKGDPPEYLLSALYACMPAVQGNVRNSTATGNLRQAHLMTPRCYPALVR